jgi:DNA ligase-1
VEVLSYNLKTKKVEAKKVVNWFDNGIKHKWVGVYFGDRKPIWATTNHKFYDGFEFTEIGTSDMATTLIDNSICPVPVERIFDDPFARAYDIEVEDNHNYFAGDFLVHNCRLVTFIDSADNITFYSRQGKEFLTLDVLKKELSDLVRAGKISTRIVLDGELCLMKDGVEDFQSVMKEVRRKDHTIENPMYILFDYLTDKEFFGDISVGYRDRLLKLAELPKSNYFKVVEHCDYSEDTFKTWQERVLKEGWEGLIARKNVPYESGRKKTMLKIKNFNDAEYVVEGVDTNGETTIVVNGLAKQVPAIRCLLIKHKGNTVGVGSGLTPEQRIDFLAHPEKIVGKTITVKFFSETQDENGNWSLRFPVVKYIYENKRDC